MAKPAAKTLDDFRAAHDKNVIVPNKIRAALSALEKEGAENWEYELDFLKRSGLSVTDLATFRSQFEAHIVEAASTHGRSAKRVWFGNAKVAAKVRAG